MKITSKHCYLCNTNKSPDDFHRNHDKRDGRCDECKTCDRTVVSGTSLQQRR